MFPGSVGALKKVFHLDREEFAFDVDPFICYGNLLSDKFQSWKDREEALAHVGHFAYTSTNGQEYASRFLPYLIGEYESFPTSFKLQIVKSLSEIICPVKSGVHQDNFRSIGGLDTLAQNINPTASPSLKLCKWSCYTLTVAVAGNGQSLRHLKAIPDLRDDLEAAANDPHVWDGDKNYADILLKLLGWRSARDEVQEQLEHDFLRACRNSSSSEFN